MGFRRKSCPICDSSGIKLVRRTLTFNTKHGKVKALNLLFHKFDSYKEQFFDEEANNKIETYVNRFVESRQILFQ